MDGIKIKVVGNLKGPFEEIAAKMPRLEKRVLYRAAYFMRDKIRQSLTTAVPAATQRNPKYSDTLVDAVQFTPVDGASLVVNAMGNRKPKSGTFRTRFFEEGTKDRYQKTYMGVKRKHKKFIGHIGATHFFKSAVDANRNAVTQIMQEVLEEYVDTAFKNNT